MYKAVQKLMLSKEVLVLLVVGLAVVKGSSAPPTTTECSRPDPPDGRSIVSSLLQVAGYSDTCVAAALDSCSSVHENNSFTSFVKEARAMVQQVSQALNNLGSRPRHCKDLLDSGDSVSGLRQVYPYPGRPHHHVTVYCDHTVDGGGWTVLQRRSNEAVRQDFYRTWVEYQLGFGDLEGEFWLGLNLLHQMTSTSLQELRIDLHDYDSEHRWAKYGMFQVGSADTNYLLTIGRYTGDAGDALTPHHNGHPFSTHDADHDNSPVNCAQTYRGAWWYNICLLSNLNGQQYVGNHSSYADGINWSKWRGLNYSLRRTSLMIRPAF